MDRRTVVEIGGAAADAAAANAPEAAATTAENGPICIVDDDEAVCDSLGVLLQTYGFTVVAHGSAAEFLNDERRRTAKCLVVDHHMPGMAGLDLIAELRRNGDSLPAILITGRLDAGIAERVADLGVTTVLEKPFAVKSLVALIRGALGTPE